MENVDTYHRLGLRGVYICGLGGWKHLEHVYSYVIPRILWNPEQDLVVLLDEFCAAWYGSAAKPMRSISNGSILTPWSRAARASWTVMPAQGRTSSANSTRRSS